MYKKNKSMDFCRTGVMKDYGKVLKDPNAEKTTKKRSTGKRIIDTITALGDGSRHSLTRGVKQAYKEFKKG